MSINEYYYIERARVLRVGTVVAINKGKRRVKKWMK